MKILNNQKIKGFTLVEVMLALALSAILVPAFTAAFAFAIQTTSQGERFSHAYAIANQQMEALYTIKSEEFSWDWESSSLNTAVGQYYQPTYSGGLWDLGTKTTNPVPDSDGYTSKIEISQVRRNTNNVLYDGPGSIEDFNSRYVTVYVEWMENSELQSIDLTTLVTNN